MGFGREDTDCEVIEIIQILPGSSNEAGFIAALSAFRKLAI
jgi:hypothetical protein